MTVVIADSSPLNYLTMIGSVDVLHQLYGAVVVPQQVIDELIDPAAPPRRDLRPRVPGCRRYQRKRSKNDGPRAECADEIANDGISRL
jgi:hypothetical protein